MSIEKGLWIRIDTGVDGGEIEVGAQRGSNQLNIVTGVASLTVPRTSAGLLALALRAAYDRSACGNTEPILLEFDRRSVGVAASAAVPRRIWIQAMPFAFGVDADDALAIAAALEKCIAHLEAPEVAPAC
jgi:hypothetical protein